MYKRSTTFALNILNLTDDTHLLNCHELPIVLNICIIYLSVVGYFREYNKKFMFWFNSFNTEHLLKLTSFFQNHDLYRVKWHENIGYSCLCTLKRVVHESNSLTCVKCMTHINYNGRKRDQYIILLNHRPLIQYNVKQWYHVKYEVKQGFWWRHENFLLIWVLLE